MRRFIHLSLFVVALLTSCIRVSHEPVDVNAGVATEITISNYHELINMVHKVLPETQLFLLSTKPSPGAPGKIPLKGALNPEIEKIAAQYDFVEYINVFNPLFDKDGQLSDDLYLYDRSHLNEKGYAIWAPIIMEQLIKVGN